MIFDDDGDIRGIAAIFYLNTSIFKGKQQQNTQKFLLTQNHVTKKAPPCWKSDRNKGGVLNNRGFLSCNSPDLGFWRILARFCLVISLDAFWYPLGIKNVFASNKNYYIDSQDLGWNVSAIRRLRKKLWEISFHTFFKTCVGPGSVQIL